MARVMQTTIATMPCVEIWLLEGSRYGSAMVVVLLARDGAIVLAEMVDAMVGVVVVIETSPDEVGFEAVVPTLLTDGVVEEVDDSPLLEVAVCICCVVVHRVH